MDVGKNLWSSNSVLTKPSLSIPRVGARGAHHLSRCRLRAFPVPGLVGMQENYFLKDYFDCLGPIPLATQR